MLFSPTAPSTAATVRTVPTRRTPFPSRLRKALTRILKTPAKQCGTDFLRIVELHSLMPKLLNWMDERISQRATRWRARRFKKRPLRGSRASLGITVRGARTRCTPEPAASDTLQSPARLILSRTSRTLTRAPTASVSCAGNQRIARSAYGRSRRCRPLARVVSSHPDRQH